jgi:F-box-like
MTSFKPEDLPIDILPPILAQLIDRRDLHAAALVSRTFNRAATPVGIDRLTTKLQRTKTVVVIV